MLKNVITLVTLTTLTLIVFTLYNKHHFLPDNDLWKEDYYQKDNVGEYYFNAAIDAAYEIYKPVSEKFGDTSLVINKKWEDSTVNANVSRFFGKVTVNMYGGLFRRQEVTLEGFVLVICHELSHAYGGTPYINPWQKISVEGQSDYIGAKHCLHKVLNKISLNSYEEYPTAFMENICDKFFQENNRKNLCIRSLIGGQSLGNLLAAIKNENVPDYETPDTLIAEQTNISYPGSQCRLDTYLNGTLQLKRPPCWFKP